MNWIVQVEHGESGRTVKQYEADGKTPLVAMASLCDNPAYYRAVEKHGAIVKVTISAACVVRIECEDERSKSST